MSFGFAFLDSIDLGKGRISHFCFQWHDHGRVASGLTSDFERRPQVSCPLRLGAPPVIGCAVIYELSMLMPRQVLRDL